jgi:hypothetical protein
MAHYAKLGINSKVISVEVVADADCQNAEDNDLFLPKKPYASWVLNTTEARWQSPIGDAPELEEGEELTHVYQWDEDNGSWNKIEK